MPDQFLHRSQDNAGRQDRRSDALPIWEATRRFETSTAPAGLAFVQDLLNTCGCGAAQDLLCSTELANEWSQAAHRAWSLQAGVTVASPQFDRNDLVAIRGLRDRLSDVLALSWIDPGIALTAEVDLHLTSNGVTWTPSGVGWRELYSLVLCEVLVAQRDGTWSRLKSCAGNSCRVVFYDRTWDRRERLHTTRLADEAKTPGGSSDRGSFPSVRA